MLKSETRVIGGHTVTSTQLPSTRSFGLLTKLGKILSPVVGELGPLFDAKAGLAGLLTQDVSKIGPALTALFGHLADEDLGKLQSEIFAHTRVMRDGRLLELRDPNIVDLVFGADLKALLGALAFAIEVNYRDFFSSAPSESSLAGAAAGATL